MFLPVPNVHEGARELEPSHQDAKLLELQRMHVGTRQGTAGTGSAGTVCAAVQRC